MVFSTHLLVFTFINSHIKTFTYIFQPCYCIIYLFILISSHQKELLKETIISNLSEQLCTRRIILNLFPKHYSHLIFNHIITIITITYSFLFLYFIYHLTFMQTYHIIINFIFIFKSCYYIFRSFNLATALFYFILRRNFIMIYF